MAVRTRDLILKIKQKNNFAIDISLQNLNYIKAS